MDLPAQYDSFYIALDPCRVEIRLLEIVSVEPIVCKLSIVSLLDHPDFSALSYTWGDASVTEPIIVEGSSVTVTSSLIHALKAVYFQWTEGCCSDDTSARRIWVDALCINQPDIQEKNSQIPLMHKIYTSAQRTFCWVGQLTSELSDAFDAFTDLIREFVSKSQDQQEGEDLMQSIDIDLVAMIPRMSHLFYSQYWTRVWIVQEVVLSKDTLLVSGTKALSLEAISFVNKWLEVYGLRHEATSAPAAGDDGTLATDATRARVRESKYLSMAKIENARSFVEMRASYWSQALDNDFCRTGMKKYDNFSNYAATNPKDLVYGLLAVFGVTLEIDYSPAKTVADVYCDFVKKWLSTCRPESLELGGGDLWFLAHAGIGHSWEDIQGLPSWAPNFVAISKFAEVQGRIFCMARDHSVEEFGNYRLTPTCSGNSLHCAAVFVDQVADIGPAIIQYTGFQDAPAQWIQWAAGVLVRSPVHEESQRHRFLGLLEAIVHTNLYLDKVKPKPTQELVRSITYGYPQLVHWFLLLLFEAWRVKNHDDDQHAFYTAFRTDYLWDSDELDSDELARWRVMRATPELRNNIPGQGQTIYNWIAAVRRMSDLRPFETKEGYLGLCPPLTEEGDIIAVLCGCSNPVVLREIGNQYFHVGVCYVSEYMNGRSKSCFNTASLEAKKIEII